MSNTSRRAFLRGAAVAGATVAGGRAIAQQADPAITEIKPWMQYLGEGVDARPYGTPSEHEAHVVRRNVEWLTADPVSSVNFRIDIAQPQGSRLSDLTLLSSGETIDPARSYTIAGWASVNEGTEGPPIWDVVEDHIKAKGTVSVPENTSVAVAAN